MKKTNINCVYYFYNKLDQKKNKNKNKYKYQTVAFNFFIDNELTNQTKILSLNTNNINTNINRFYVCKEFYNLKMAEVESDIEIDIADKNRSILLQFDNIDILHLKKYFTTLNPSKYIHSIIYFYKYLLHSISLLVSLNIFHNHILFDSIVVSQEGYPLLSNFSFSIDYSRRDLNKYIQNFLFEYEPGFTELPLELHIISYLLCNKLNSLSSYNIENIVNDFIDNNNILKTFGDTVVSSYKEHAIQYYKKYINQSYEHVLTDMLQYAHTWDNYALSILFLRILIGLHRTINIKNKFIIYFMKLLVGNIHLVPLKRLTIEETMTQFDSILYQMDPKDYRDIIDCF
jgi:hypothetical protein